MQTQKIFRIMWSMGGLNVVEFLQDDVLLDAGRTRTQTAVCPEGVRLTSLPEQEGAGT